LNANASSKKPKVTFTEFNQPPDLGKDCNQFGKSAKSINGKAKADENPSMPITGANPPCEAACTNSVPTMGPVQEKETTANANAIKKMPKTPPLSACLSAEFAQADGRVISNAPKKESAKMTKMAKKTRLNQKLVDSMLSASAPKIQVTKVPSNT
jgi:hypothetical protein